MIEHVVATGDGHSATARALNCNRSSVVQAMNDPYVQEARNRGFRSRSAFKILEIDDKYKFLKPGKRVLDLGCAPGGWSQVAADRTNSNGSKQNKKQGFVLGLDLRQVEPIIGVHLEVLDFLDHDAASKVRTWLADKVDVVMSDMAPDSSGHKKTDHLRIMALCESAAFFADHVLKRGGVFVAKVLSGGAEPELQKLLKVKFEKVINFKPPASRKDSSEKYVVAIGFRA